MAYTYDDFLKAANNAGLYDQFSAYDLNLAQANPEVGVGLLNAKIAWNTAADDAARAAANQQAEQLRLSAGNYGQTPYTAGSWGLEYNPLTNGTAYNPTSVGNPTGSMVPQSSTNQGATGTSFTPQTAQSNAAASNWDASNMKTTPTLTITPVEQPDLSAYQSAPVYNSAYTPQINTSLNTLGNYPAFQYSPYTDRYDADIQAARQEAFNRDPFSYDYATDPVYQAYAKQYRREGERSMQNTLAQNAALTGGVASSAATAAAQQANNYYNAQLADKIPQLYTDAYNRYLQDYQMSQDKLNTLMKLSDTDWNRYDTSRKFDFTIYQDAYDQVYNQFKALLDADKNAFNQSEAQRDQYNKDRDAIIDLWYKNMGHTEFVDKMLYEAEQDAIRNQQEQYTLGTKQDQYAQDMAYQLQKDANDLAYKYAALGKSGSSGGSSGGSKSASGNGGNGDNGGGGGPVPGPAPGTEFTPLVPSGEYIAYSVKTEPKDTTPVYMDSSSAKIYGDFSQSDLAKLIEEGVVRGMYMPNGTFRYIYVGDVTQRKTQEATPTTKKKSPTATAPSVERN